MMTPSGFAALCAACLAVSTAAMAYDKTGAFKIGAGVGATPCGEFAATMKEARAGVAKGDSKTASKVSALAAYVLGFQTGFNASTPHAHDVFLNLGNDPVPKALAWIQTWCEANPESTFGAGVVALAFATTPAR